MRTQISARLLLFGLLALCLTASGAPKSVHYNKSFPGRSVESRSDLWSIVLVGAVTFVVGFIAGATMSAGGGLPLSHRHRRRHHTDWDRVSRDAVAVIRKELAEWRGREYKEAADWDEFDRRLEDRLREEIESNRE